jgi:hypothetical protein
MVAHENIRATLWQMIATIDPKTVVQLKPAAE